MKLSEKQKAEFARRCADAGMSQSEMVQRCLFGRLPEEKPLAVIAREHTGLIHQLRAAVAAGIPVDAELLENLTADTRELISVIRQSLTE